MADLDPTAEECLDGNGGRVSLMQKEVIRLLRAVLPSVVALVNARENISIEAPQYFYAVRESLEGAQMPCVAVGSALSTEPLGTLDEAEIITLMVYVVNARTEVREQVDDLWDLAQLAHRVLKRKRGSHCLPDGREVWRYCRLQGATALPADWQQYSGIGIHYSVNQAGLNLWPHI